MKSKTGLALAAAAASVGAVSQADAALVYTPLDITITTDGTGPTSATLAYPSIPGGRNSGNFLSFTASTTNGIRAAKVGNNSAVIFTDQTLASGEVGAVNLTAFSQGEIINRFAPKQGTAFTVNNTITAVSADGTAGQFLPGIGEKYVAYNYTNGGREYNGWIGFETTSANGSLVSAHISGIAIGDGAVPAGIVPEPSSLGLLAMGAAGLVGYRRRSAV